MTQSPTIGASLIAAIVGLSPFQDRMSAWKRLVGIKDYDTTLYTQSMEIGHLLEDDVLELYKRKNNCTELTRLQDQKVRDIFHATIDAYDEASQCIVEAKTSSKPWLELPEYYKLQVQLQMYVHGERKARVAGLVAMRYVQYEEEFDEDYLVPYIEEAKDFYEKYVLTGVPPIEEESKTTSSVNTEDAACADDCISLLIARAKELKEEKKVYQDVLKAAQDEYDSIMQTVADFAKGRGAIVDSNGVVLAVRKERTVPGRLDVGMVKQIYPEVYKECYTSSRKVAYYSFPSNNPDTND